MADPIMSLITKPAQNRDRITMDRIEPAFKLRSIPERCPGIYVLHLYCKYENPDHGFEEFPHEPHPCQTHGEAARMARSWGWSLHRDGTATCPRCAKRLKTPEAP